MLSSILSTPISDYTTGQLIIGFLVVFVITVVAAEIIWSAIAKATFANKKRLRIMFTVVAIIAVGLWFSGVCAFGLHASALESEKHIAQATQLLIENGLPEENVSNVVDGLKDIGFKTN